MKAVVYETYGPPEVLQFKEIAKPVPKANDVLVKVIATTVTIGDTIMRSFKLPVTGWQRIMARLILGIRKPRKNILGMEFAGIVEAVGQNVTRFKPGDAVFASTFSVKYGAYTEYKCMPETGMLLLKPDNLTFEEAAAAPGAGMTALRCLGNGNIQPGQKVLIYGASGAVGTNAVQIAKHHYGADVTGVCSTANLDLVKSLGADHVIDYTQADFTQSGPYDLVFDAVGKTTAPQVKPALKPSGVYLNVHTASGNGEKYADLVALKEMIEAGKLKPFIDKTYPFDQILEAHRYVDKGHKRGNVAITVASADPA